MTDGSLRPMTSCDRPAVTHDEAFGAFHRLRLRTPQATAKLVWVYIAPQLDWYRPRPISIAAVATVLDVKTRTVGKALASLVAWELLTVESPAGKCEAGWYYLGASARPP
jgi:hypothetical protein